ncbi:hypothetical protein AN618_05390 [Fervidicola ferrireducens]|uniref:Copper transporter MctB n=1 Tax=Fervidicola ferrireducens TaxID=520764 RepID=A0A140LC72_9FIRM|nr:copper transporter [Fervidicola ferrireducens]KXG78147.1 hypothetical protein AN618_05390 [Fervidicola ferrireducens]
MYNFKHVTILLIAVFISLGIGIAVGFTANSDKLLIKQQKAIIDQLEKSYNIMKESNRMKDKQLKSLIEKQNKDYEFLEQNFETLLKGSLEGKKGTILQLGNKGDLTEVIKCLEDAGAIVQNTTVLNDYEKEGEAETINFHDFVVIVRTDENLNPNSIAKRISDIKPVAIVQTSNLPRLDITTGKKLLYIDNIDTIIGKYRLIVWLINNS